MNRVPLTTIDRTAQGLALNMGTAEAPLRGNSFAHESCNLRDMCCKQTTAKGAQHWPRQVRRGYPMKKEVAI